MDNLLRKALDKAILSEKDLHNLMIENPDEQMKGVIDTIHTLFCKKEHKYQLEDLDYRYSDESLDKVCLYYPEANNLENMWEESDHRWWAAYTVSLLSEIGIVLPGEMSDFTKSLLKVGEGIIHFLDRYPAAKGMVVGICELERP